MLIRPIGETIADVLEGRAQGVVVNDDWMEVIRSIPDQSIDHVIMDPPYEAEAHTQQRRVKRGILGVAESEPIAFPPMTEMERNLIGHECGRITKRWALAFCQAEALPLWIDSFVTHGGLAYKRACIWVKKLGPGCQPQLTGDRPGMGYETMCLAHAPGRSRWNGGGKVGVYPFDKFSAYDQKAHPTQKPILLMEALIRDLTDPGEIVLDPYAGSGTTAVACVRLGRRFIAIERDPTFYATALRRISDAREQSDLLSNDAFVQRAKTKRKQGTFELGGTDEIPERAPVGNDEDEALTEGGTTDAAMLTMPRADHHGEDNDGHGG